MNVRYLLIIAILLTLSISGYLLITKGVNKTVLETQIPQGNVSPTPLAQNANIPCSGKSTIELTEGPYYTANTPENTDFTKDNPPGDKITITGYVLDTSCKPISHAWIDFWQADGEGNYDNSGYKLRGHQYTDEDGRYTLTTVIPGEYRTPHIHLKIRVTENSRVVTSQLFIPGVAQNETDSIYDKSLLLENVKETNDGKTATYNFVL